MNVEQKASRARAIERIRTRRKQDCRSVCLGDLIDHYALTPDNLAGEDPRRKEACYRVAQSIMDGEFSRFGGIRFLHKDQGRQKLTRNDWDIVFYTFAERKEVPYPKAVKHQYFDHSWVTLAAARAWCSKWKISEPSEWRSAAQSKNKNSDQKSSATVLLETGAVAHFHTGAPGRPTVSHLVRDQFNLRVTAGTFSPTLAAEAKHLALWLEQRFANEPKKPPPLSALSIENTIRTAYREAKATQPTKPPTK